jgi:hypothetical protein
VLTNPVILFDTAAAGAGAWADLAVREIKTMVEETNNLLKRKQASRDGSNLSDIHFHAFKSARMDPEMIQGHPEQAQRIKQIVLDYHNVSLTALEDEKFDEVQYVQPRSQALCRDIFEMICPHRSGNLSFAKKGVLDTNYHTTLLMDDGSIVEITGQADIAVVYRDLCVMVWEDKNLNVDPTISAAKAQALAEAQAKAEALREFLSSSNFTFCGILTNGSQWSLDLATFEAGSLKLSRTSPISANAHLDQCCNILVHAVLCAEQLMKNIDNSLLRRGMVGAVETNEAEYEYDDDDGVDDDAVDDNGPAGSANCAVSTAAKAGAILRTLASRPSGKGNSSSSSRNARLSDQYGILSFNNLRRHNLRSDKIPCVL